MSQRPKDTVVRDQSHSLSNIHASRVTTVNLKTLADAIRLLKCRLQQKGLPSTHIDPLFFEPFIPQQEVSILQLKSKFETLGIDEKRSQSLARYLVEPQNQNEIIYNENAKATQKEVIDLLNGIIGQYFLYTDDAEKADDLKTIHVEKLQKMIVDNFGE